ncbi:predicted protein [Postia placenta Mad-698-R]|nr:predicted protein [Postia placenta Mad-698-R]
MTQSGDNTEVYSYLSRPRAPLKSDMKAFAVVMHRMWWTGPLSIARNRKEELNMPGLYIPICSTLVAGTGHEAEDKPQRPLPWCQRRRYLKCCQEISFVIARRKTGYSLDVRHSLQESRVDAMATREQISVNNASPTATRTRRRVTLGDLSAPRFGTDDTPAKAEEAPRKTVLRERLRARCLERALRDRERKIAGRRHARSEASSDGDDDIMEDDDDDDEEDDEAVINDELFRRLIANGRRKQQHQYRLSYAYDVGSSFDPDMEDINEWEQGPLDPPPISTTPEDLDEEELAAYAEEAALLEDLWPEDLYSLSDLDAWDLPEAPLPSLPRDKGKGRELPPTTDGDVDMTTS